MVEMVQTSITVYTTTCFPPPEALESELKLMRFGRAVLRGIHSKHPKAPTAGPKNHRILVAFGCLWEIPIVEGRFRVLNGYWAKLGTPI